MLKNTVKLLIVLAALSLLINGAGCSPSGGSNSIQTIMSGSSTAKYVGSNTCKECHGGTYASWNESFHGAAAFVTNKIVEEMKGRTSVFAMLSCIYCKGTGINKSVFESYFTAGTTASVGLDATYAQLFNEPFAVGCEACHNAGSEHVASTSVGQFKSTIGNPGKMPAGNSAAVCGQCHSKGYQPASTDVMKTAFSAKSYVYDRAIKSFSGYMGFIYNYVYGQTMPSDWVRPSYYIPFGALQTKVQYGKNTTSADTAAVTIGDKWLKNGLFQIVNSGHPGARQFANFEQSGHNNVAACFNCHDPHSTKLRNETNDLCTKCHTRFSNTTALTAHTKHGATSDGSKCWNCHMPEVATSASATAVTTSTPLHLFKIIRPDVSLTSSSVSATATASTTAGRVIMTPETGTITDASGATVVSNKQRVFLPNSCAGGATGTCHVSNTGGTKFGTLVAVPTSATGFSGGVLYSATDATTSVILDAAKNMFPNSAALNYK